MAKDIKIKYDNDLMEGDIDFLNGDLIREDGLETAVLISIFTNKRALDSDNLINPGEKRGWWGDLVSDIEGDKIGSKFWFTAWTSTQ